MRVPPRQHRDRHPNPGEKCVISDRGRFKRDALLFDRIYLSTMDRVHWVEDPPDEVTFGWYDLDLRTYKSAYDQGFVDQNFIFDAVREFGPSYVRNCRTRFTTEFFAANGVTVVPTYSSDTEFEREYPLGNDVIQQAVLQNVSLVSDYGTTWGQIIEFRNDDEALRKYRDLRLWLQTGIRANSVQEAVDIIGRKIANYEWAIRKHGLATVSGAIGQILDWKKAVLPGGTAALGAVVGGPALGAIAGGLCIAAQTYAWLADRMITLEDIKRGSDSEVAILYDIREKFGAMQK